MTEQAHLNPDDFPDSPYAEELRRGVTCRPFRNGIEEQYVRRHLARVRTRVRLWFSLLALSIGSVAVPVLNAGPWSLDAVLHVWILLPASIAMVFIAWSPYYETHFPAVSSVLVPILNSVTMIFLAHTIATGESQAMGGFVLNLFAVFFFSGLRYRVSLITGLAMSAAFFFAALFYAMPAHLIVNAVIFVALMLILSATVSAGVEVAYRRAFLEGILVRDLAARDGLTGVTNRRAFDEHLRRIWQQALRDRREIGVMMIDLDHFKSFNDFHGHQAGDSALRQVAQTIQAFARRPLDMAARYGGEEFVVILYDLSREQLMKVAESLRQAVLDLKIEHRAGGGGDYVTVSIGVGIVQPAIGRTPQGAIQFADEALYQAKEAGRNKVIVRGIEEYGALKTGTFNSPRTIRVRP